MITQTYKIDLVPHGEPVVVHVSQYDVEGRTLAFELFNGGVAYNVPGTVTAILTGTKPDGTGFMYNMAADGNTVSIDIPQQVSVLAGDVPAEITLADGAAKIGSANFVIRVERSALDEETVISDTDLPAFEQLVADAEAYAQDAAGEANAAEQSAQDAADTAAALAALVPAGGTAGQFLQRTSGGTQWADIDALPHGGTVGQVLAKQSSTDGDADWETPAFLPNGGTAGQVLTKASGTDQDVTWTTPAAAGIDLLVTVTLSGSAYVADHTFAEIEACIASGHTPYAIYNNNVFHLYTYTAGTSASFLYTLYGGRGYRLTISSGSVILSLVAAYQEATATLSAANWSGNVYTYSNAMIPAAANGTVTVTMPDQATAADMQAAIAEYAGYDLYAFNQRNGAIDIYARGAVPTTDIQLVFIVEPRY